MIIKKTKGTVLSVLDLSSSAREIRLVLDEPIDVVAGCFINLFHEIDGKKIRRAYSISSHPKEKKIINISVRKNENGQISPLFWSEKIVGTSFEIMGVLGLNTAEKMKQSKRFLIAFGIGVSVVKSLLHESLENDSLDEIHILTGSKNEEELLYKNLFDLHLGNKKISIKHVLSSPINDNYLYEGYIQDNISEYDFSNADIYICGAEVACKSVQKKIIEQGSKDSNFYIEGFH